MKKLKDLTREDLKKLYDTNRQFAEQIDSIIWDNHMFWQSERGGEMGAEVFDYHDHYDSFYLTTPMVYGAKAPEKIAGKLNEEYLTDEEKKVYARLNELNAVMENAEEWDEGRPEYEQMTEEADELARLITEDLRELENITQDEVMEELVYQTTEGSMAAWQTDGEKVFYEQTIILK